VSSAERGDRSDAFSAARSDAQTNMWMAAIDGNLIDARATARLLRRLFAKSLPAASS